MALIKKTNRVEEALGHLIEQFRDKDNIRNLLSAFVQQAQDVENAVFEILLETDLDAAAGQQLDGIGQIVGEHRDGRSDAVYRIALRSRILVNNSSGTIEDVIGVVAAAIASGTIVLTESSPAEFRLEITTPITEKGLVIGPLALASKPAGVHMVFVWREDATNFRFDTVGQGFDTVGAGMIGAID